MFKKRTPTLKRKGRSTDGDSSPPASETVQSACSSRSVANETANEMSLLEASVLINDDSGEVRENELLLEEDDENDVTKDLNFSRMSPSLFPVSPKKPCPTGDDGVNVTATPLPSPSRPDLLAEKLGENAVPSAVSEFYNRASLEPSAGDISTWATSFEMTTPAIAKGPGCYTTPGQDFRMHRQTIAFAIQELNAMTDEMLQFIQGFETKHPSCKDPSKF